MKVNHIEELEKVLKNRRIPRHQICIVGSSVMSVYNLRQNNDIDIIMSLEERSKISKQENSFKLSENIECVGVGWLHRLDNTTTDEDILFKENNHFILDGFKYCNLDLLRKRKSLSGKEKDKKDMILIERY